jgi:uncharacterized membrane protein
VKKTTLIAQAILLIMLFAATNSFAFSLWSSGPAAITPEKGVLSIPIKDINDGEAHHFKVKADDGTMVTFFTLKSRDGIIRAAIDSCDVCYKSGKGYFQRGDFMVCENCGQRFASNKINVLRGGCNPAPLRRRVVSDKLVINMTDINANVWYMRHRQ